MSRQPDFAPFSIDDYIAQLCHIEGGQFQMGSASGYQDEKPVHSVTLSPFRVGATPVTVAMWKEYCHATGISMPKAPKWGWKLSHPMVNVSYDDIAGEEGGGGYVAWASRQVGTRLRLPTEAQWEYCARDGGKQIEYPWGQEFNFELLWCSARRNGDANRTSPVVRDERVFVNALGLSDMAGNVYQWCRDWHGGYSEGAVRGCRREPARSDGRERAT